MRVRVPPQAPNKDINLAYIVGLSLGDGNLSNPNGRAVRLRITCDKKYPKLIETICVALRISFPQNRVGLVNRKGCVDVSLFSNYLPSALGWKWNMGGKEAQKATIPEWIKSDKQYTCACLRGLFQTDGCMYKDRGYTMVNFTNVCAELVGDTFLAIKDFGYKPNLQRFVQANGKIKYTIRITREAQRFIEEIGLWKA